MVNLLRFMVVSLLLALIFVVSAADKEVKSLQKQLVQAQTEAKDNVGKPIPVEELASWRYKRCNDNYYAFVEASIGDSIGDESYASRLILVSSDAPLPKTFLVKDGHMVPDNK